MHAGRPHEACRACFHFSLDEPPVDAEPTAAWVSGLSFCPGVYILFLPSLPSAARRLRAPQSGEQQRANNRAAIDCGLLVVVHVTVDLHIGDLRDHGVEESTGDSMFLIGICPILSGFLLGPSKRYFLVAGI